MRRYAKTIFWILGSLAGCFALAIVALVALFIYLGPKGFYMAAYPIVVGMRENVSIRFYGRVIDQDGKGVPNATVEGKYEGIYITEYVRSHDYSSYPVSMTTDSNGNFTLPASGAHSLHWENVSAPGCRTADWQEAGVVGAYTYANDAPPIFKPDPAHPVIFHLWRSGNKFEKLVTVTGAKGFYHQKARSSGVWSVWFGISTPDRHVPTRVEEGRFDDADFQIAIQFSKPLDPNANPSDPRSHFDWFNSIDVPHGGIIESHDAYLYRAPESGYVPHYEFQQLASDPKWISGNTQGWKKFYLKSRDGNYYAALRFQVRADPVRNSAEFGFDGILNPNGSTNLEPPPGAGPSTILLY